MNIQSINTLLFKLLQNMNKVIKMEKIQIAATYPCLQVLRINSRLMKQGEN